MRRILHAAAVLAVLLATAGLAPADVKLHPLFTDNAVLQRDIAVPVWGTADPGEDVSVACGGQKKSVKAGADGAWMVKLDAMKAGGPLEMTVTGKNTLTVKNLLVGEVWICSGQSNMEWSLKASAGGKEAIEASANPKIRLFTVPKKAVDAPVREVNAAWKECGPDTSGGFSGVGYFFGRELQAALDVPVGLIHTSWGGTAAELWTSRRVLEGSAELKPLVEQHERSLAAFAETKAKHAQALEEHKKAAEKAKAEGKDAPPAPKAPKGPGMAPSCLYNGMIAPLLPYAIGGAIWYQGESNAGRAAQYRTLFPAMITNWREDWGQPGPARDFPFLFVQLANFMGRKAEPGESGWAELREAQTMTLSLPKTGMAVIIDIGDAKDIHPKNKLDVGRRLALAAQHVAYGKDLVYSGPMFDTMTVTGDKACLRFKHVGGGLEAKGDKLTGFAIAGEDRKFVWAEAKIEKDAVVAWSPAVPKPVAVRYAWADNPECNLTNKEGLPASPFRTDGPAAR
jgi:sialate O-acetylesterase